MKLKIISNLKELINKKLNASGPDKSSNVSLKTHVSDKPSVMNYREIRYKRSSKWSQSIQWSIVAAVSFGLVYSIVARIDEVVIARGDLQADGAERPIKSPLAGVVNNILVKEGQLVSPDKLLITLDSEVNEGRIYSLTKQLNSEQIRYNSELEAFEARSRNLNSQLKSLQYSMITNQLILKRYIDLQRQGAVDDVTVLEKQDQAQKLQAEISQTQSRIEESKAEASKEKQLITREIQSLRRQLIESKKSKEYEILKSPIEGFVFDLIPTSVGYAVTAGETLVKIVPNGPLSAKVFVSNVDIGFIKEGMTTKVRIDAFPFTQFGDLNGKVASISTETKQPEQSPSQSNQESRFIVIVSLETQYLENNNVQKMLKPGQTVTANFIVRDKPVISLLTDAIEKALDSLRGIKTDQN